MKNTSHFDSWLVLCEHVLEIAEEEAERRLLPQKLQLIEQIADEIIETAGEYEPKTKNKKKSDT